MMKKIKLSVFGLLVSGVVAFSAIAGVSLAKTAYADDTATTAKFVMKDGGSVRVAQSETDKTGIRWTAIINEEYYNSLNVGEQEVQFGALVTPARNLGENELITEDSKQVMAVPCSATKPAFNSDGEFIFNASIVYDDLEDEQKQAAYALELVARAYVKVGEEYHFVDTYSTTRSMRAIALAAVQSGAYDEETLNGYYGKKTVSAITADTCYYDNTDNEGVFATDTISGTIQAYVGAAPVNAKIENNAIIITDAGELEEQESYTLNVFDGNGDVYSQSFVAAPKVIRTAENLSYFALEGLESSGSAQKGYTVTSTNTFDGYYVVANDIDASEYTHKIADPEQNKVLNGVNGQKVSNDEDDSRWGQIHMVRKVGGGLSGTFDGAGHTISNLTVEDQGLFGIINGGSVKNVAFTGVTLKSSVRQNNIALFAQYSNKATFSDIYVKTNTIFGATSTKDGLNDAGGNRAVLSITLFESKVVNCLFDCDIANTTGQYCYSYGLYCCDVAFYGGHTSADAVSQITKFENVYVVSDEPILVQNNSLVLKKSNTHVILAENEVGEGTDKLTVASSLLEGRFFNTAESENELNDSYIYVQSGVKRYATAEDMNAAGNDYTSFSSVYWSVSEDGVLSWKA